MKQFDPEKAIKFLKNKGNKEKGLRRDFIEALEAGIVEPKKVYTASGHKLGLPKDTITISREVAERWMDVKLERDVNEADDDLCDEIQKALEE